MAIDIEAIKKRLAQISGDRNAASGVQLWKPPVGEHRVRVIPWKGVDPADPFPEKKFYYLGNFGCLVPSAGRPDPVDALRRKVFEDAKQGSDAERAEAKALGKQLFPRNYWHVKIVDRAAEEVGPQVWKVSKMQCMRLLGMFVDEDIGDFSSLTEGRDLKVTISKTPGKNFFDTTIDPTMKISPLHKDDKKAAAWFDKEIDIDALYTHLVRTDAEIEAGLNAWLNGDTDQQGSQAERGGPKKGTVDDLDDIAKELTKGDAPKGKKKSSDAKKGDDGEGEVPASVKSKLDEEFDDLMKDDD